MSQVDSFVYLVCLTHLTRLEIINYSHDELLGPVVDMQQRNLQAFDAIQHLKQLQALRMTFCNEFTTLPVRCCNITTGLVVPVQWNMDEP